ncbi:MULTISPECIES: tetratricopeptide repeat protein [unclassified Colwellia]|uniref:tetratricopeptide repeat protein n=1 Tax=unclassified Colwellia TaxID=196834 RepID=UPI0015F3E2F2|nr:MULTISPECIES: tetratricopeptide repeat protein [unclassified Colwellia]MBA6355990.1 sel1 repeat family protein [Colwellia sp. BRX8-3]MBA6359652.1 sel1 repeat family protein [Colwellia sp. BRX8-6]MBA6366239.1 sel1 repeat family protein [Colwellia sp. BRX8-5]MBA6374653.1 sel1 repeat family protein [Colwellia sp. BRX8-2]
MRFLLVILALLFFISNTCYGQKLEAVQIYTDNQLLGLIKENKHLGQVVLDECQLVQDIEARATKSEYPSYQFLWGDMLAYGVCVKKDVPLGLHFMKNAADQALPEALEQLGRYYHTGKFMQVDVEKAMFYLKEAAAVNNLKAQIRLADIYAQGYGSPLDYPELYTQLHHSVTDDKKIHQQIAKILSALANKMPEHVVNSAKEGKF